MTTDKVRISYVHLNQPHSGAQDGSNPKYSVTVLLPKSDIATKARLDAAYQAAVNAGVSTKWNGVMPPKIECPIYDGDGVRSNGEPFGEECKGNWVFTASNKNPVAVVDIGTNPIIDPNEIYSGMYARVCISFYAYAQAGKRGIACGLEAVQKIEDGEPLAGKVSIADAFGGVNAYVGVPASTGIPATGSPVMQPQSYTLQMSNPHLQSYAQASMPQTQYTTMVDPITGQPIYGV